MKLLIITFPHSHPTTLTILFRTIFLAIRFILQFAIGLPLMTVFVTHRTTRTTTCGGDIILRILNPANTLG
jgi:hypothetical protein